MCFSAMVEQDLKSLARRFKAKADKSAFEDLFHQRLDNPRIKIPKAMEANFAAPEAQEDRQIHALIEQNNARLQIEYEAELFKQTKRRNDAERKIKVKVTATAEKDLRIAGDNIKKIQSKLKWLSDRTLKPSDSRIFPMVYAPVVVMDRGELWIRPMRYHCRPNGQPEFLDKKFDGLYNARRDTMNKPMSLWKSLFGQKHGVMVVTSFFENVAQHDYERRELRPDEKPSNVVLHFNPQQSEPMLVACLWDRWQAPDKPDLLSFAAITDEPPEEVAAAGHDRCIVPLKPGNVDAWLKGGNVATMDALLEDRERPYYEHELSKAA